MWSKFEDNLFSANHRNKMIDYHGGTMAQVITLEQMEKEYDRRSKLSCVNCELRNASIGDLCQECWEELEVKEAQEEEEE